MPLHKDGNYHFGNKKTLWLCYLHIVISNNDYTGALEHPLLLMQMRLRQNGPHFTDNIFKCISLNENIRILNKISLKYVPWGLIDNMAALLLFSTKPLSEPMMG